jgi:hypothetical protein
MNGLMDMLEPATEARALRIFSTVCSGSRRKVSETEVWERALSWGSAGVKACLSALAKATDAQRGWEKAMDVRSGTAKDVLTVRAKDGSTESDLGKAW